MRSMPRLYARECGLASEANPTFGRLHRLAEDGYNLRA